MSKKIIPFSGILSAFSIAIAILVGVMVGFGLTIAVIATLWG
jgi:hypothetical protein